MPSFDREPRFVAVQLRPESRVPGATFMNFVGTRASRSGYEPGARPSVVQSPVGSKEGGGPLLQAAAARATASTKGPIRPRLDIAKG